MKLHGPIRQWSDETQPEDGPKCSSDHPVQHGNDKFDVKSLINPLYIIKLVLIALN